MIWHVIVHWDHGVQHLPRGIVARYLALQRAASVVLIESTF